MKFMKMSTKRVGAKTRRDGPDGHHGSCTARPGGGKSGLWRRRGRGRRINLAGSTVVPLSLAAWRLRLARTDQCSRCVNG